MAQADADRGTFIWYELMTADADGAKAFYDQVVGWSIADAPVGDADMDYRMIQRSDGGFAGGVLQLTDDMLSGGATPGWYGYVHVPDVDATASAFVDAGGQIFMEPHDLEGVGRMAFVSDPQGAPLYLMDPTPPPDQPDARSDVFSVDQPQHIRWNELWVPDQDAAVAFYAGLFGWVQEGAMDMGPMGKYLFLQHGDTGIGAIGRAGPDGDGPRWSYFIGVDDIDRAVTAVQTGGGKVAGEPQEVPGGEFTTYCTDPQGAAFGLVGPRKG